jgi:hypothetical protein
LGHPVTTGHYNGRYIWNLNPGFSVHGHSGAPAEVLTNTTQALRARIDVTLIDIYSREHRLLPVGYVHRLGPEDEWYFEPSEQELDVQAPAERTA